MKVLFALLLLVAIYTIGIWLLRSFVADVFLLFGKRNENVGNKKTLIIIRAIVCFALLIPIGIAMIWMPIMCLWSITGYHG